MTAWLAELDEVERETAVRTVRCPVCRAPTGWACRYPDSAGATFWHSHTGRYLAAVRRGLVPPLPGGRRG